MNSIVRCLAAVMAMACSESNSAGETQSPCEVPDAGCVPFTLSLSLPADSCTVTVPPPPINFVPTFATQMSVVLVSPTSSDALTTSTFTQDRDGTCNEGGWDAIARDSSSFPTIIDFCPSACESARSAGPGASLRFQVSCMQVGCA